jgi:hypothetical protein
MIASFPGVGHDQEAFRGYCRVHGLKITAREHVSPNMTGKADRSFADLPLFPPCYPACYLLKYILGIDGKFLGRSKVSRKRENQNRKKKISRTERQGKRRISNAQPANAWYYQGNWNW